MDERYTEFSRYGMVSDPNSVNFSSEIIETYGQMLPCSRIGPCRLTSAGRIYLTECEIQPVACSILHQF